MQIREQLLLRPPRKILEARRDELVRRLVLHYELDLHAIAQLSVFVIHFSEEAGAHQSFSHFAHVGKRNFFGWVNAKATRLDQVFRGNSVGATSDQFENGILLGGGSTQQKEEG